MACVPGFRSPCARILSRAIFFCSPTNTGTGSRPFTGTAADFGSAQTDSSHTARFTRSAKLLYPYHPLFDAGLAPLEIIGMRSDMLVTRLPDGTRRGIPAWMFDEEVCAAVRSIVHAACLLEIVDILAFNGLEVFITRDGRE